MGLTADQTGICLPLYVAVPAARWEGWRSLVLGQLQVQNVR